MTARRMVGEKTPFSLKGWIRSSPWWAIAIGLHLLVFLIATLMYFERQIFDEAPVTVNVHQSDAPKITDVDLQKKDAKKDKPEEEKTSEKVEDLPETAAEEPSALVSRKVKGASSDPPTVMTPSPPTPVHRSQSATT